MHNEKNEVIELTKLTLNKQFAAMDTKQKQGIKQASFETVAQSLNSELLRKKRGKRDKF